MTTGSGDVVEVLHVCVGNICRSPMAERLLALHLRRTGAAGSVRSVSAGTGPWHEGDPMQPPAAREVSARGGDPSGFKARWLRPEQIEAAGLILTATAVQARDVLELVPTALPRTFVLGEAARLLTGPSSVPPAADIADLVRHLHELRSTEPWRPVDDLDDPYGRDQSFYSAIADRVEAAVAALAAVLPRPPADRRAAQR
jgi:protein-tyrosine phosphatase